MKSWRTFSPRPGESYLGWISRAKLITGDSIAPERGYSFLFLSESEFKSQSEDDKI